MKFKYHNIKIYESNFANAARNALSNNRIDNSISYLSALALYKYTFYSGFMDTFIEETIRSISSHIIHKVNHPEKKKKDGIVYVFYDSFTSDNKALTEQYLDALISQNVKFLYIHRRNIEQPVCSNIKKMLSEHNQAKEIQVPSSIKGIKASQWLYDTITHYGANKLLMQLLPNAIEECVAFSALPKNILRYQINLTDHTFWAGTCCTDYTLEFRHYGCNLSFHERGIEKEHVLLMPYYPVMKPIPFRGFPKEVNEKVVFFAGGAPYKVVDKNQTFFKLCKSILDECPNAVILFAGGNSEDHSIEDSINKFGLQGRMYALGHRPDIFEVFKHCDIYINTFPFSGGLMCQFAAQCSKPILNYVNTNIEQIVSQKKKCHFTSFDFDSFFTEARDLYLNIEYRVSKGEELNKAVISKADFRKNFNLTLSQGRSIVPVIWHDKFERERLDLEGMINYQNQTWELQYKLLNILGIKLLVKAPAIFLSLYVHRILKKIKK